MRHTARLATLTASAGAALLLAAPVAHAQEVLVEDTVVDEYSGVIPRQLNRQETPPADVESVSSPSTLPFTGGEVVLLTGLGVGAVAAGAVLVAAGRRRSLA